MREWLGRVLVGGTIVMILGGLWTYASLRHVISQERRVYYPPVRPPLPPPPDSDPRYPDLAAIRD